MAIFRRDTFANAPTGIADYYSTNYHRASISGTSHYSTQLQTCPTQNLPFRRTQRGSADVPPARVPTQQRTHRKRRRSVERLPIKMPRSPMTDHLQRGGADDQREPQRRERARNHLPNLPEPVAEDAAAQRRKTRNQSLPRREKKERKRRRRRKTIKLPYITYHTINLQLEYKIIPTYD